MWPFPIAQAKLFLESTSNQGKTLLSCQGSPSLLGFKLKNLGNVGVYLAKCLLCAKLGMCFAVTILC